MTSSSQQRSVQGVILMAAIGLSIVGLIRGIREPIPAHDELAAIRAQQALEDRDAPPGAIPATVYADMRRRETGPTSQWEYPLPKVATVFDYQRCITCHDPHTLDIAPDVEAKKRSLKIRSDRRAYNGAPPIVPHEISQTDDAACSACHRLGARIGELVARRMPHRFLPHCLQCHAPPPPPVVASLVAVPDNTFSGLPTPAAGPRAYPGAPPLIPHSTWMRHDCLSCHGGTTGWPGLEVTHRWRTNCLQCHGTSMQLEQGAGAVSQQTRKHRP